MLNIPQCKHRRWVALVLGRRIFGVWQVSSFVVEVVPVGAHTNPNGIDTRSASMTDTLTAVAEIGEAIAETCSAVFASVEAQVGRILPDELTLEFGVSLAGETGVPFVGKVAAESTFTVTAKWTKKSD